MIFWEGHDVRPLLLLILISIAGCQPDSKQAVYTVGRYNPEADPAVDLAETIKQAQAEHKRIILQVGGEWCQFCHRLDAFIRETPAVASGLHDGFLIMKVSYTQGENENTEFLSQYPDPAGYPHWYVLESDGTLLHSQDTSKIQKGNGYSEPKLLAFIEKWKPGN